MNSYIWISAASTYQYVPVRTSTSISNLVVGLALFSFCIRHPFVRAILIISGFNVCPLTFLLPFVVRRMFLFAACFVTLATGTGSGTGTWHLVPRRRPK